MSLHRPSCFWRLSGTRKAVASLTVAAVAVAGCGGSDGDAESRPEPGPESTQTTTPTTGSEASSTATSSTPETTSAPTTSTPPPPSTAAATTSVPPAPVQLTTVPGAEVARRAGFPELTGRRVGLLGHAASMVGDSTTGPLHLVDALRADSDLTLVSLFSPEHGFRSDAGAGVTVGSDTDPVTGLPIYSLYGDTKAPTSSMLEGIDVLAVDLQDVGARYYTYISTLGLTLRAASDAGVAVIVYDRPNPQGMTSPAGPMRDEEHESFVGQFPIPALHAMTIGELTAAIVGEKWLGDLSALELTVIEMEGYAHEADWADTGLVWTPPSPGLQTSDAALLYPALIWLEPTIFSYGSGTRDPFTSIAAPWLDGPALAAAINAAGIPGLQAEPTSFVPVAIDGMNQDPKYEDQTVNGVVLTLTDRTQFDSWTAGLSLLEVLRRQAAERGQPLIEDAEMFDLLAGSESLRRWVNSTEPAEGFAAVVAQESAGFNVVRDRYLRYR